MITPEQLAKLPRWAQEHIRKIEQERYVSVRTLNEFCDTSTKSRFWIEDAVCTGEQTGPTVKRCYINTRKIAVSCGTAEVYVAIDHDRNNVIHIVAYDERDNGVYFMPTSRGTLTIIGPEKERGKNGK